MRDELELKRSLEKLADSFLGDQRSVDADVGWGQFVGQPGGTQLGLYGTCAGLIVIATAYDATRVPPNAITYLTNLWEHRNDPTTEGPRYFALTARHAFFYMALRFTNQPSLAPIWADVGRELCQRVLSDGLLVSWRADSEHQSATGDEFSTALTVISFALTTPTNERLPPVIERAASALQKRMEGSPPGNTGIKRFYLAAITLALGEQGISRKLVRVARSEKVQPQNRDRDAFYFWDYKHLGKKGLVARRDYFHVPSDAVDILLATSQVAGRFQKLAALDLAYDDAKNILASGLYFAGRDLAASKFQAWMAIALSRAKLLTPQDRLRNRLLRRVFAGAPENFVGSFVLPSIVLALSAAAASVPDRILDAVQWLGVISALTPSWWKWGGPLLQILGLIIITVSGETLWARVGSYVRNRLP